MKTNCAKCGVEILLQTSNDNNGLCMPCKSKVDSQRTKPLTKELKKRLAKHGYVSDEAVKYFENMLGSEGEDSVIGYLDLEDESLNLYHKWFPYIQEYEAKCRTESPLPTHASLTGLQLSEYRILKEKMIAFRSSYDFKVLQIPNRVILLKSTIPGLIAAKEVFIPKLKSIILLISSEMNRWFDSVYNEDDDIFMWAVKCSWLVEKAKNKPKDKVEKAKNKFKYKVDKKLSVLRQVPENGHYKIFSHGLRWGPFHGGSKEELWKVSGVDMEFYSLHSITCC